MLEELRARQAQPAQQANAVEPLADPNFDWSRLVLPPDFIPGPGRWSSSEDGILPLRAGAHPRRQRSTRGPVRLLGDIPLAGSGRGRT